MENFAVRWCGRPLKSTSVAARKEGWAATTCGSVSHLWFDARQKEMLVICSACQDTLHKTSSSQKQSSEDLKEANEEQYLIHLSWQPVGVVVKVNTQHSLQEHKFKSMFGHH